MARTVSSDYELLLLCCCLLLPSDVEWDPTGRYVASSVTSIHQMENGFNMWSFNGKLLYK
jgi:hypothetical protein